MSCRHTRPSSSGILVNQLRVFVIFYWDREEILTVSERSIGMHGGWSKSRVLFELRCREQNSYSNKHAIETVIIVPSDLSCAKTHTGSGNDKTRKYFSALF